MDAVRLKKQLCEALVVQSGLEQHRAYLGMSGIGRCARELYWRYADGLADASERHHYFSWLGYLFECGVVSLLTGQMEVDVFLRVYLEIVADFDSRFRGHVDYQTTDGDLVEIKSVNWPKFEIVRSRGALQVHRAQMQMYLRHGGWERGFLVYVARDVPWQQWRGLPLWVFEEPPDRKWADALDTKAKMILTAIDKETAPRCECGRCRR